MCRLKYELSLTSVGATQRNMKKAFQKDTPDSLMESQSRVSISRTNHLFFYATDYKAHIESLRILYRVKHSHSMTDAAY